MGIFFECEYVEDNHHLDFLSVSSAWVVLPLTFTPL